MIFFESDHTRSAGELYYSRRMINLKSRFHLHNSFELICVETGTVTLLLGDKRFAVGAGQAALIFPNQVHGYESNGKTQSYVFVFSHTLIGEFARKTQKAQPICPVFDTAGQNFGAMICTAAEQRYLLKSKLYAMLHRFEQHVAYVPRTAHGTELLGSILSFISEHYKEPITMRHIARELGYDHRYLTNLVQKGLQTTFRKLLNEYRIANAKRLLTEGNTPIEQIAWECGYESLCSFNRNFKEQTGTAPSLFRKMGG